jgi:hypothetical protein
MQRGVDRIGSGKKGGENVDNLVTLRVRDDPRLGFNAGAANAKKYEIFREPLASPSAECRLSPRGGECSN